MSHPKSSSTFTTDYKVRGKEFIGWGYGHPAQLSAWRIKGNHSGWPKPFCLGTFSSYCKATKIPLHHLYQASVRLPTFLLNPSPCHHFQSMWTDQGQLAKSYFLCRTSSPAPLCSSLLSSGVVLFHLLEFAHFLFPDCPSFLQEEREVTEGSHCQFHQPHRLGDEQSKYLYSEGWDLCLPHDFRISMSLAGEDKNLASLRKESKIERKTEQLA